MGGGGRGEEEGHVKAVMLVQCANLAVSLQNSYSCLCQFDTSVVLPLLRTYIVCCVKRKYAVKAVEVGVGFGAEN